ncbi:protein of unknown function [Methylorubrum extorquens]|uniref:Uncharacterized protein n=1 Tax=Methylorubrum extorquens TaxID=408 RepID=A0A2N9AYU8_METEX|nr:protein of unknown function [Methylorubrum extorquens]
MFTLVLIDHCQRKRWSYCKHYDCQQTRRNWDEFHRLYPPK